MSQEEETLESTSEELRTVLDEAIAATELPVTRRQDDPGLFLGCDDGTERLSMKVNADDPPTLEPLSEALVDHLVAQGWERVDELRTEGGGGPGLSVFLHRDGFEAIVDLVRGSEGTGVDLEVLSPCRDMRPDGTPT